jgi:hypothetical protein
MATAVLGLAGSLISGFAAVSANNYQAAIAKSNAEQARVNAQARAEKAMIDAEDRAVENAGIIGLQEAQQGASGLALNSPSLIRTRARSIELANVETDRIIRGGNLDYANYMTEANQFDAEAGAYKAKAGFALFSTAINGFGSFLSAATPTAASPSYIPQPIARPRLFGVN